MTSTFVSSSQPVSGEAHGVYRMSRSILTVMELWQEWNAGLPGKPSISFLETRYQNKWRSTISEAKNFSRRKPVIDAIQEMSGRNGSFVDDVVPRLEARRLELGLSLVKLGEYIKAGNDIWNNQVGRMTVNNKKHLHHITMSSALRSSY
jgi:hypothetical protein